jgi:hypothetical protein
MGVNTEYLPREIRLELEEERKAAKRASLQRVRARVRRRVKRVAEGQSDNDDCESELAKELSTMSSHTNLSQAIVRDLNGEPVSFTVLLVVLKLQRNFRARRERRRAEENKNPWSNAITRRSLSRTSWDERVQRRASSDTHTIT